MTVAFNVQNTHKFCVFVAIKVKGDHDAARFSPELYVGPGATMAMGELVTGNKIHVTWTWREDKVVAAKVADFELKGVVCAVPRVAVRCALCEVQRCERVALDCVPTADSVFSDKNPRTYVQII
eukprot:m.237080 g.237080  ORF g.237080 m.237080 type:complete len:124 (-) comp19362_c0_seq10:417-788(-)